MINGATYHYFAFQGTDHEEGDGVYTTATSTLTRALIRNSSNAAAVVSFTAPPIVIMGGPTTLDMPGSLGSTDTQLYRDAAAQTVALANGTNPATLRVYNTTDQTNTGVAPTNYERGIFDWNGTANALTIGTQAGGSGLARDLRIINAGFGLIKGDTVSGSGWSFRNTADSAFVGIRADQIVTGSNILTTNFLDIVDGTIWASLQTNAWQSTPGLWAASGAFIGFSSTTNADGGAKDAGFSRVAAKVISFTDGAAANANGWPQWGGQARVTADVTFTSTTVLATVTGLSVNVAAGRTYSFVAELSWTDAAAGGLQLAMAGTCTATAIIYDGYIIDSGANGIKGNAQATALGTAVANAATTGTAGHARISGTITVNAAGTLLVQAAQSVSNATATTIKRGSYLWVQDMP